MASGTTDSNMFAMQTSRVNGSNIVEELRNFLNASDNAQFKADFVDSFNLALNSGISEFNDYNIKSFKDYIDWYEYLLGWVPTEQEDGKFVYHVLCLFYFVMDIDGPLKKHTSPIEPGTHSPYTWLSEWVIRYAKEIGKFMDTPGSITAYSLDTFYNAATYHMEDYPVPAGGWKTFNEFFARHIDPAKRPIDNPDSNETIVSPADAVFDDHWAVDSNGLVSFKDIPWPISELLDEQSSDGQSNYSEAFAGGQFCHSFLGPNDYHRLHAPVSGTVIEARVIEGLCYLQVETQQNKDGKWTIAPRRGMYGPYMKMPPVARDAGDAVKDLSAPDEPGYQFIQARALVLIETPDIGLVATLPIGMAQVSSVVMSVKPGDQVKKGDEIGYFQFGGSDIVMVFEAQSQVNFADTIVGQHYNVGERVATTTSASTA